VNAKTAIRLLHIYAYCCDCLAPIESAVCRPVVIVLIVPRTRAGTKANRTPRTHTSAKFGAKNLLRLDALNSRDALSVQRAALLAMNEKVNEYISLCLTTLLIFYNFAIQNNQIYVALPYSGCFVCSNEPYLNIQYPRYSTDSYMYF
jgi:hypothetical protein